MQNKSLHLELHLKHIAQTYKPLLNENYDLKDTLIEQNRYISDCKNLLLQLLDDKDPDGNDRSIIKAIGDLNTICNILVDEFNCQREKIRLQDLSNQALKLQLQQEYENLRQRDSRLADEQRNFQLQFQSQQQEHRRDIDQLLSDKQRLCMIIEDHAGAYQRLFDKYSHQKEEFEEQLAESSQNYELAINNLKYTLEEKIKTYEAMLEHIRCEYVDIMMKREDQFVEQVKNHEFRVTQINSEWMQKISSTQVENRSLKQLQEEQTRNIRNLTQQLRERDSQIVAKVNQIAALTHQLTDSRMRHAELIESQRQNQIKTQNLEIIKKEQVQQVVKTSPDETIRDKGRMRQSIMYQPPRFNKNYNIITEKGRSTQHHQNQNQKSILNQSTQDTSIQAINKKVDKFTQSEQVSDNQRYQEPLPIQIESQRIQTTDNQPSSKEESQIQKQMSIQITLREDLAIQCDLITEEERYKKMQQMIDRMTQENEEQKVELRTYYEKGRRTLQSAVEMWKNQLKEKQIRVNQLEEVKVTNEIEIKRLNIELENAKAEIIQVDEEKRDQWKEISKEKVKLNDEFQKYLQQNEELSVLKKNFEEAQETINKKLWTSVQQQENLQTEYDKKCEEQRKYRADLIKAYEMVKYLQLEVENYKKVHNMFKPNSQEQLTAVISDSTQPPQSPHKDQMRAIKTQIINTNPTIERTTANTQERKPHSLSFHHQKHRMRPARTMQLSFNLHNVGIRDRNSPPADRLTKFAFNLNEQQAKRDANLPKIYRYHTDVNEDPRAISSSEDILIMQASENLLLNMFARSPTPTIQKMTKKKRSPRYTSK